MADGTREVLNLPLPEARPEWKHISDLIFRGWYALRRPEFDDVDEAVFVREANHMCETILDALRPSLARNAKTFWTLEMGDPEVLAEALGRDIEQDTWLLAVSADLDPENPAHISLWNAWGPLLNAALHFAMPTDEPNIPDIPRSDSAEHVVLKRLSREDHSELAERTSEKT